MRIFTHLTDFAWLNAITKSTLTPTILSKQEHQIPESDISRNALNVLERLHEEGFRACLVGGAVRDLLLQRRPKDFDIATDAEPEEVKALFRNCRLIGRRFRLAHVYFGREILEVATFRAPHHEAETDTEAHSEDTGRIVRDNVFGTIEQDVWRRDFTVNSLYYDIADASVIDYANGIEDLEARQLSMIGDTEMRFREDPVRMLRAVRFAAKLGFSIDEASEDAIFKLHNLIESASPARLFEEFLKLMHSGHAVDSFHLLRKYQLFNHLFPLTGEALDAENDGEKFQQFILNALENTDKRIAENLPVTPAFLVAVLLWIPVDKEKHQLVKSGMIPAAALQRASQNAFSQQVTHVAVPRRFSSMSKEIWDLQARLLRSRGKRIQRVAQHQRFRAGYDFLCLRAKSFDDSELEQKCQWWTEYQETKEYQQAVANRPVKKYHRSPPRKRSRKKRA